MMKEFESLEKYTKELEAQSENTKKITEEATKKTTLFDKLQKSNESLKAENEKFKKENSGLKSQIQNKTNEFSKLDKELKEKIETLNELNLQFENFEKILLEKDKIISEYEMKFEELNFSLQKKEEELKILIKLTSQLRNENKSNVEEMTKQAVNTIKVFYNTLNNNNNSDNLNQSDYSSTNTNTSVQMARKSSTKEKNQSEAQEMKLFLTKKEIENMLKEKKAPFILEETLTSNQIKIPKGDFVFTPQNLKEFLMNLNFSNELLKTELLASLTREANFLRYLDELNVGKSEKSENTNSNLKENQKSNANYEEESTNKNIVDELCDLIEKIRHPNDELIKENQNLKNEILQLKHNKIQLESLCNKLKENSKILTDRITEKLQKVEKCLIEKLDNTKTFYEDQISKLEKKIKISNNELKTKNDEIKRLLKENENLNVNIDKVRKENESLSGEVKRSEKENERKINESLSGKFKELENSKISKINKIETVINENFLRTSEIKNQKLFEEEIDKLKNENKELQNKNTSYVSKLKLLKQNECKKELLKSVLKIDYLNKISLEYKENKINAKKNIYDLNYDYNMDYKLNESICKKCKSLNEKINEFKSNILKPSTFKDIKQFYINYYMDIDKLNTKIEEVANTIRNSDNQLINDPFDRKIKITQIKEILAQVTKLTTLLSIFIGKYNKNLNHYTLNLKKLFEFVSDLIYSNSFFNTISSNYLKSSPDNELSEGCALSDIKMKTEMNLQNLANRILKLIYELNDKTFSMSDLKKIYFSYENRNVQEILENFSFNLDIVKDNMIDKNHFDSKTYYFNHHIAEISEFEDEFNKHNLNNSFKTVNDRLLKLKRLEYDFTNLTEVIRNFLVVQEILIKMLFFDITPETRYDIQSDNLKRNRIKILEKIFYMMEETIFYKCEEFDDNLFFIKKFVIGVLKNQKKILLMTLE